MLETVSIFLTIIPFVIGIIKLWGIDEFEELTLSSKDKLYKKTISFFKKFTSYFVYLMLLGVYYHMFSFLVNDYAVYYFIILLSITILMYLMVIIFWIFSKSERSIMDEHKNELKMIRLFNRVTFVYLSIAVWLFFALQIGLDSYVTFYSTENIVNVMSLSAVLAVVIYILSTYLSKFYELLILKKIYYLDDYPSYYIKKVQENEYYLLKDLTDEVYMYLDFKKTFKSKIEMKIITEVNSNNFMFIVLYFILWILLLIISFVLIIVKLIDIFNELISHIIGKILHHLEKKRQRLSKMDSILLSIIKFANKLIKELNNRNMSTMKIIKSHIDNIKCKLSSIAKNKDE